MGSKINRGLPPEKPRALMEENKIFHGTAGVSQGSIKYNFLPAFCDEETGAIYISCTRNGEQAAIHKYDGLPAHVVISRNDINEITEIKPSVVSGFIHENQFYSREQAMRFIAEKENKTIEVDNSTSYLS